MHFAGRDLKPYAEPVTPDRLVVGEMYFTVQFVDQHMLAPVVEPVVFLGNNLDPGPDGRGHYFQDAGSYLAGLRHRPEEASPEADDGPDVTVYQQREGQISHIFEFERGLDELLKCSIRRASETPVRYTPIVPRRPTRG
jgi:hypothetical protein